MKFLALTALLYFGFLFYQNSLISSSLDTKTSSNHIKVNDNVDYSKYYDPKIDSFAIRSIDEPLLSPIYKLALYSIVDSLHVLPFVRNFLQKSYTMSDWLKLSSGFYFSFFKGEKGLDFFWVSPSSEKILSKLSKKQKDILNFGGVAQIKWSVYDILYIKLSKNKKHMLLSSIKNGVMRVPLKEGQKSIVLVKKGFLPNLKYLLKSDGLAWINTNVDAIVLSQQNKSYKLDFELSKRTSFFEYFKTMSQQERYIKKTGDDLSFQVNLSKALKKINLSKINTKKIKGAQFFLRHKDLFDGSFLLQASLFQANPKFQLQTTFKNPGSSGRFISELESYVSQKSLDLSKLNKNEYSLTIPLSPIQFFLKREMKDIFISNGGVFSHNYKKTDKKALLHFALSNIGKKELLYPHIDRLIRTYHKKRMVTCFENLSKKDALFKFCPMGGNYSVSDNGVICDLHGSESSSLFLDLVKNDLRRPLAMSLIDGLKSIQFSLSTSAKGLSLSLLL
ncbi:MAG: hypothetical protein KC646_14855 [Candidatus Cloacimonetes bacterium]|nr:hypothetical protein [Candidatus Cloacimonadota bacterium]